MTAPASTSAARSYLDGLQRLIRELADEEAQQIDDGAALLASTIQGGGLVHVFGTGHSHMLAEEMFYRAGGLAAVNPVLEESLMLHSGAVRSTELERTPGVAEAIFDRVKVARGDTLIVASNSGGNVVCVELAERYRDAGARVVAIVSRRHARSVEARDGELSPLEAIADVVIDNHGVPGDAAVEVAGLGERVGATSTVAGAAIINALTVATVDVLVRRGHVGSVLISANVPGGDAHNRALLEPLRDRIRAL